MRFGVRKQAACLLDVPAAVDADRFAGDEIGFDEEHNGADDGVGTAPTAQRRRLFDSRELFVGRSGRRDDRARRDGVDED